MSIEQGDSGASSNGSPRVGAVARARWTTSGKARGASVLLLAVRLEVAVMAEQLEDEAHEEREGTC